MFAYNGKEYELKFNMERLKLIESSIKTSMISVIVSTNGSLPVAEMEACFAYCLKEAGSDTFVPRKEAMKIAQELIEEKGYLGINNLIIEKLAQDMPFLFRAA